MLEGKKEMTREEAKEKITKSMECHDRKVCGLAETCEECPLYVDKDTEYEAHKILISALEQESCDAISRKPNCIDCIHKSVCFRLDMRVDSDYAEKCGDFLTELPPVTRHMEWIIDHNDSDYCYCQKCRYKFDTDKLKMIWGRYELPPYCPNCGAKMVEPQESKKVNCKSTKCENCINHNYCDYEPQESEG